MTALPMIFKENEGLFVLLSRSLEETVAFGRLLAGELLPDDVVSLDGDLGAGKTALTRGLAEGLKCRIPVSSPTFTLLIEHPAEAGGLALYHFDAYRLDGGDAFCEIGLDDYFDQGGVSVVEWGRIIEDVLPPRTLRIRLLQPDPHQLDNRLIEIAWPGCPTRMPGLIDRLRRG